MAKLLGVLLFLISSYSATTGSSSSTAASVAPFAAPINVPAQEWLQQYLGWAHHHSGVLGADGPSVLNLPMPSMELFSATGASLYYGGNDQQNAAYILNLQRVIPSDVIPATTRLRPTLLEYIEMLNELKPYKDQVETEKKLTLFAVTYRNKAMCSSQNAAIDALRKSSKIRVIEINLTTS